MDQFRSFRTLSLKNHQDPERQKGLQGLSHEKLEGMLTDIQTYDMTCFQSHMAPFVSLYFALHLPEVLLARQEDWAMHQTPWPRGERSSKARNPVRSVLCSWCLLDGPSQQSHLIYFEGMNCLYKVCFLEFRYLVGLWSLEPLIELHGNRESPVALQSCFPRAQEKLEKIWTEIHGKREA